MRTWGSSWECVGNGQESGWVASPVITPRSINVMQIMLLDANASGELGPPRAIYGDKSKKKVKTFGSPPISSLHSSFSRFLVTAPGDLRVK